MNPELKTPIKLPKFNWDKILVRALILMGGSFLLSMLFRVRTMFVLAEIINIGTILFLLVIATYALIARSVKNNSSNNSSEKK